MKRNPVTLDPNMKNGYIPAPYVLEPGEHINDFYLEPVLFPNENGPTIGVTTCGVIVKDGQYFKDMDNDGQLSPYEDWRLDDETRAKDMVAHLPLKQQAGLVLNTLWKYFKDMDNDGQLSPYEDWRLDDETRAKDMVAHLPLKQQAGLVLNTLWNTPLSMTRKEAQDENGNIIPSRIFKRYNPSEPIPKGILPGLDNRVDDGQVLEQKLTAGVYRGEMRAEAGVAALYQNLGSQYVEYEAGLDNRVDDGQVLEQKLTAGVYRGEMRAEAGVAALYQNLGSQYVEYEACQGGVAIPYSLHTNPINIGYPDFLGMGAACMGDGSFDMVYEMAQTDRKMMHACGLNIMYGPQVDVSTDPRWPRNSGTYGERPEVTAGITRELVRGYQDGEDGLKEGSIVLTVKHFPGDGPAENGFEPHLPIGQWRLYPTEGSMEKYHLPPFQAAFDMHASAIPGDGPAENGFEPHLPIGQWRLYPTEGSMEKYHLPPFQAAFDMHASAIMPDYSRVATDGRSTPQYYRGKLTSTEQVGSTYSKELITDLARDTMGFTGYVNSDSGITTTQIYGVEDLTVPQRYAKAISAGTDVIGGN